MMAIEYRHKSHAKFVTISVCWWI